MPTGSMKKFGVLWNEVLSLWKPGRSSMVRCLNNSMEKRRAVGRRI